jgi:hypothetical protein
MVVTAEIGPRRTPTGPRRLRRVRLRPGSCLTKQPPLLREVRSWELFPLSPLAQNYPQGLSPAEASCPSMRCSSCSSENREGRKFCAGCGAALTLACASVWITAPGSMTTVRRRGGGGIWPAAADVARGGRCARDRANIHAAGRRMAAAVLRHVVFVRGERRLCQRTWTESLPLKCVLSNVSPVSTPLVSPFWKPVASISKEQVRSRTPSPFTSCFFCAQETRLGSCPVSPNRNVCGSILVGSKVSDDLITTETLPPAVRLDGART